MKPKEIVNKAYIKLSKYSKMEWERILSPHVFQWKNAYKTEFIVKDNDPFPFCSDIHNLTRQQWDSLDIVIHKDLQDDIVDLEVMNMRGLFWKNDRRQICLFQSNTFLYGCWVKPLDERKSFFVCEIMCGITDVIPIKLVERMNNLQKAVNVFPRLYDPVTCRGCKKWLPSWVVECTRDQCKMERFGRCKDESCYIPTTSKDQEKCSKCGGEIEQIKF